jgi:ABC-type oligopeptide transport system ATPase subunit
LQERLGLSYLFIAHDLAVVRHISHRIGVMKEGRLVEMGDADEVSTSPRHPYTRALLEAEPLPDPAVQRERRRARKAGRGAAAPAGARSDERTPREHHPVRITD